MGLHGRSKGKVCLAGLLVLASGISGLPWAPMQASPSLESQPQTMAPFETAPFETAPFETSVPTERQLSELQQGIDRGTLVIAFGVGHRTTEVFLVDDQGIQEEILHLGYEELDRWVDSWVGYIVDAHQPGSTFFSKAEGMAEDLYTELLAPFEARIEASDRVVFIPDGPLHRLPFGCLKRLGVDDVSQYLVQWKSFQTAPSMAGYLQVIASGEAALHSGSQLVALGDADYGSLSAFGDVSEGIESAAHRDAADLLSIPGSGVEVRAIASMFPRHRLLLGKDATKERLKSLDGVDVLHLSAHGLRAALLLSPMRLEGKPVVGSERLDVSEILGGDIPAGKLVVLSACDSALGVRSLSSSRDDGRGLGWAFLQAGARSVVSSLWKVDDRQTVKLMQRFYHHIGSGLPQGEALQRAQVELIEGDDNTSTAPFFWAAFQMQGHWR